MSVMRKGTENRRIGETNMNRESSRSHSVFTCIMESSSKGAEDGCTRVKFSRLNLVDLAGEPLYKLSCVEYRNVSHILVFIYIMGSSSKGAEYGGEIGRGFTC